MMGTFRQYLFTAAAVFCFSAATSRSADGAVITLNFEGLSDSTFISTQYTGLTFTNAIIFTSGISLNEFDFPPRSGVNVLSDSGGAISILFTDPILDFLAYFTYVTPVTLQGFDGANQLLAQSTTAFTNNTASGGDSGSSPNEVLHISTGAGFTKIIIEGDSSGSSFTLDDAAYDTGQVGVVPEPSTVALTSPGLLMLLLAAHAYRRR